MSVYQFEGAYGLAEENFGLSSGLRDEPLALARDNGSTGPLEDSNVPDGSGLLELERVSADSYDRLDALVPNCSPPVVWSHKTRKSMTGERYTSGEWMCSVNRQSDGELLGIGWHAELETALSRCIANIAERTQKAAAERESRALDRILSDMAAA